ncbi:MAG: pyridoxal 5'-phosphate synthase [Bacteroidota bacterium]
MEETISGDYPNPFATFARWFHQEVTTTKKRFPGACVLSTIGLDGFPNARNVSLKEIHHPHLIFTTALDSLKGREILKNNKVALTFWWEASKRQVRIQGLASEISDEDADFYFSERSKSSQAVSVVSKQSHPLTDLQELKKSFNALMIDYQEGVIPRPKAWKGFKVNPLQIEFLEFKETRFHNRVLYTQNGDAWEATQLQP